MRLVGLECLARFAVYPYRAPDHWFAEASDVGRRSDRARRGRRRIRGIARLTSPAFAVAPGWPSPAVLQSLPERRCACGPRGELPGDPMKLYYMPSACSLSVQIALHELDMPYAKALVDGRTKTLADGTDYTTINPRGQVPLLELDDGTRLTEGPVIVQYLADQKPSSSLLPPAGTIDRYRELEWLNYLTSEVHQRFYELFKFPHLPDDAKEDFRADLDKRLAFIAGKLADGDYLMGDLFTAADGYLFTMLRWAAFLKVDLTRWPNLVAYRERVAARPAVQVAMREAGLKPS
jgi:glutathione S-transferase